MKLYDQSIFSRLDLEKNSGSFLFSMLRISSKQEVLRNLNDPYNLLRIVQELAGWEIDNYQSPMLCSPLRFTHNVLPIS